VIPGVLKTNDVVKRNVTQATCCSVCSPYNTARWWVIRADFPPAHNNPRSGFRSTTAFCETLGRPPLDAQIARLHARMGAAEANDTDAVASQGLSAGQFMRWMKRECYRDCL
jgi:hypothetical protein